MSAFPVPRLARMTRFLRLVRLVGVTARAIAALRTILWRRGLACVAGISVLIIFAGAAALALLEPQTVKGGFADGIWWAIVTASTVGYGDIAPATAVGRLIAVLLMLSGVGLVSTLAASITAYFLGAEENNGLTELNERMARIEGQLNALLSESIALRKSGDAVPLIISTNGVESRADPRLLSQVQSTTP
jgi:voltage-gated potassium channel